MSYSELLRSPFWQKKRLEIMQRDSFQCVCCGETEETLNVHHTKYVYGKKPWEYPESELMTLCHNCHSEITIIKKEIKNDIDEHVIHLTHLCGLQKILKQIIHLNPYHLDQISALIDNYNPD